MVKKISFKQFVEQRHVALC